MTEHRFPLYRKSANGLNHYRIDSPTALVEVQGIGGRLAIHRLEARAYPERLRIQDLIAMVDGHVQECPAREVEELLAAAPDKFG